MRKIDKEVADAYYRKRVTHIVVYLTIWFVVSFGVVMFAEPLSKYTINGMPFHYFMGAQGSLLVFVVLLFVNAVRSDQVDREFGIDEEANERLGSGKAIDH
ncbi:hypothetical protein BHU72_06900 [Desulfuribacillus stibiiarsenatis]|uniref:Sodium symporter small subunit domain-containing protein n=1 Tax=Desulfuribacillus stibiiarsenatis TaxID=1390249 RepID=A0A1E5L4A2_9FIRM|nr:sodium/substrate symporter small subunit [Desulfuribacillus stibiiarsenatis]OEH84914.1 hypothetical protein BHU72_06900 [Desulfuribacillus stibiiarsenatis]